VSHDSHRSLNNRPALRDLLEKLIQHAQQQVEEAKQPSQKLNAPQPIRDADPEDVKKALARAKRLLGPSSEELRIMPSPSKLIH
jgi:hypothetical protein